MNRLRRLRILASIALAALIAPTAGALPYDDTIDRTVEDANPVDERECTTFDGDGPRGLQVPGNPTSVEICDEDGDARYDTLSFDTDIVHNRGTVSITDHDYDRGSSVEEEKEASARLKLGAPYAPILYADAVSEDTRNDDNPDDVEVRSGVLTQQGDVVVFLHLFDRSGDGLLDSFEYFACSDQVGCPGPSDVPDVGTDDVPKIEPVFVPGVGWVP